MWIVRIALQRPYTFIVMAIMILLMGAFSIARTAVDIFPNINIPIVAAIWSYGGLQPDEMSTRIVLQAERSAQTTVNDIEHSESQSLTGISIIKFFFQPTAKEELSYSQVTGVSQSMLRFMPPGTTPPFILAFNASTVPIMQLALSSDELSEAELFDLSQSVVRPALSTVAGAATPWPYGGKQRQVQVDLDPAALRAHNLSGNDVVSAIGAENLILPAGTQKIGDTEFFVGINASPLRIDDLNNIPVVNRNGNLIYVRDVAHVRDGSPPQTNIARREGRRAVVMSVMKTGAASTLEVINGIKQRLPQVRAAAPPSMKIEPLGDQSLFVRAAVDGVVREAVIAAALTGLMILLFLGSWRSTLIISVSIPLSILASIGALSALGETINIMTLGGLALAVGILVDDATVTIENINWHLEHGATVEQAILDGAEQIALPALVSTLAICIVFIPMFLLGGIAKYLFVPLAEAVVFAMLASYVLSRTLVPTLAKYWLEPHHSHADVPSPRPLKRLQLRFEARFLRIRAGYEALLTQSLAHGRPVVVGFFAAAAASALLAFPLGRWLPGLGQDFFPNVDSGQIKLHLRARTGLRIEDTAALTDQVEDAVRQVIPADEIASIVDNVGLPYSGINLAYSISAPVGPGDADVFVTLKADHRPTANYVRDLRRRLPAAFPSTTFMFLPADIVSQTLNFGLPSPIDVQVIGSNVEANHAFTNALFQKLRAIPGLVDLRVQQARDYPKIEVEVDRNKAQLVGLTEHDVAANMLVSLSGSVQTAPSFWIDPKTGTQYSVGTQTPQYRLDTPNALALTPITNGMGGQAQVLANLATFRHAVGPAVVSHYDASNVFDIYGSVQDTDLGFVAREVDRVVDAARADLPRGTRLAVRGQVQTMTSSFNGLLFGLLAAVVLVYLLIVVNFQSWTDPLIVITALPVALAGIVWMLFLTHTTVSVPALTGAIMCMGVATANSVLVISFARERLNAGIAAAGAALEAGVTRFRPVLMTALAMIIGMVPMALGLGDGGEQNAPLGRAVIGGLLLATVATLFLVPTMFALIHGWRARQASHGQGDRDE